MSVIKCVELKTVVSFPRWLNYLWRCFVSRNVHELQQNTSTL